MTTLLNDTHPTTARGDEPLRGASSSDRRRQAVAPPHPGWFHAMQSAGLGLAIVLVGLAAGFFFTYQFSIVPALAEVDDETYVATFQSINETIRNTPFGIVFFGSIPALCAALALVARTADRRRWFIAAALVLYVAVFAITAMANVPLNDQLGEVIDPTVAEAADARTDFEDAWNRLNLIRAALSFGALVSLGIAATLRRRA